MNKSDLSFLISPISLEEFWNSFYEKTFLHVKGRSSDYYKRVLTINDIDECLSSGRIPNDFISMFKNGIEISKTDKTELLEICKNFEEGYSLLIDSLHGFTPNLRKLTVQLNAEMRAKFWANLYITPSDCQAFERHYDGHDVFIMQISGSKDWKLYDFAVNSPGLSYKPDVDLDKIKLLKEVRLEPGDLLYIPRGMGHEAISNTSTSTHVTLGMVRHQFHEVFEILRKKSLEKEFFRRNTEDFSSLSEQELSEKLSKQLLDLFQELNLKDLLFESSRNFERKNLKAFNGHFINNSIVDLDLQTVLELRTDGSFVTRVYNNEYQIYFNGVAKIFPLPFKECLDLLLNDKKVKVQDMSNELSNEFKLHIAKQLVEYQWVKLVNDVPD